MVIGEYHYYFRVGVDHHVFLFSWKGCLKIMILMCIFCGLQDIASKIVNFSQEGPRTVCILSATGAVSNFTLRQPSVPGPGATYEVIHLYVSCQI